jgi:hypothetical protein
MQTHDLGMCRFLKSDLHYSLGVPQDAIKRKSCLWKQVFEFCKKKN